MAKNIFYDIKAWITVLIILPLVFCVTMSILFGCDILKEGIVYYTYIIFGIIVPGYALFLGLRMDVRSEIEAFTYIFFLGYLITFISYFAVVLTGLKNHAGILFVLIGLISLIYILFSIKSEKRIKIHSNDVPGRWICITFITLITVIKIFTYAGNNVIPPKVAANALEFDALHWIGNTIELTKGFPPFNFRFYPEKFNYHYFSSIQLAYTSLVTGIKPVIMGFAYQFIIPNYMIVLAGYCLFSEYTNNYKVKILTFIALLFTSGIEEFVVISYSGHMFMNSFGFDYGMGLFLFVVFIFIKIAREDIIDKEKLPVLLLFFTLLCGTKSNFGCASIEIIGLFCLVWFFDSKTCKKSIIVGFPILLCFLFVYLFVTNASGYAGSITAEISCVRSFEQQSRSLYEAYMGLMEWPIPTFILDTLFFLMYCIVCQPLIYGIVYYIVLQVLLKKKKLNIESWILLITTFTCAWIGLFVGMQGTSQMYFMMTSYPVGIIFILNALNDNKELRIPKNE